MKTYEIQCGNYPLLIVTFKDDNLSNIQLSDGTNLNPLKDFFDENYIKRHINLMNIKPIKI